MRRQNGHIYKENGVWLGKWREYAIVDGNLDPHPTETAKNANRVRNPTKLDGPRLTAYRLIIRILLRYLS